MMKHLALTLLIFSCLQSQAQLRGRVEGEGSPLVGATVSAGKTTVMTDTAGRFAFPAGTPASAVRITMSGFEPLQVARKDWEEDKELLLTLQPQAGSLDAVVVTGTLKPVQRLESPIAVEVYSSQFLKKNPAPSVFESLQGINGVRPQINCSVCNTGDIHINGLEGPYTMVTLDGMPIVSALSSVYGLFGIPSQLIDRIEIVKGPASGLYGSEAIGGLINIITRSPQKAPRLSATIMSTSWREHTADLGLGVKLNPRLSTLLGVHLFQFKNRVDDNRDGFTDVAQQQRISFFNKWNMERKEGRVASLAARFYYEDRWGGETRWQKQFRGSDSIYGESIDTRRWEVIGQYQLPVAAPLFYSTSLTLHEQDSWYGTTPYKGTQRIFFNQLKWEGKRGRHDLLAGLAGRYQFYDDNSTATMDTVSGNNRADAVWIPGLFLQDEWKLHKAHSLLLGMRIDHHPVHKYIFTPRIAYKWGISDKQVFRMNSGTGFRVVNLFTEDHAALTGARAVEIREELKPEQSYNVNLNYMHKIGSGYKYLVVDASAWYTYFQNQIIADYDTDPQKIIYENLRGHALSRGLTLNLEFSLQQRLKGIAGITLQDVQKVEEEGGKTVSVRPKFTERWSGTWQLSYSFPVAGLSIDYTGNVYGPMELPLLSELDPRSARSPVWSLQNIQLTKWLSNEWEVFGGVKNLLNWTPAKNNPFLIARAHDPFDKQVSYDATGKVESTPLNPYALTFDPNYIYAPNQGIRFFLGLRYVLR